MEKAEGYKIWKNPQGQEDGPDYMGEFYPPNGQVFFYIADLKALGFPPGEYTVRVPDSIRKVYMVPEWQKIAVLSD